MLKNNNVRNCLSLCTKEYLTELLYYADIFDKLAQAFPRHRIQIMHAYELGLDLSSQNET